MTGHPAAGLPPLAVDAAGYTSEDPDAGSGLDGPGEDPDAEWERHQDDGTWPAGYGPP
jgi:hypothetical protein